MTPGTIIAVVSEARPGLLDLPPTFRAVVVHVPTEAEIEQDPDRNLFDAVPIYPSFFLGVLIKEKHLRPSWQREIYWVACLDRAYQIETTFILPPRRAIEGFPRVLTRSFESDWVWVDNRYDYQRVTGNPLSDWDRFVPLFA